MILRGAKSKIELAFAAALNIGRWRVVPLVGSRRGWNGARSIENVEYAGDRVKMDMEREEFEP